MRNKLILAAIVLLLIPVLVRAEQSAATTTEIVLPEPVAVDSASEGSDLADRDAIELAISAHGVAVEIFAAAFAAEIENMEKKPWSAVRDSLLEYWSEDIVDYDFKIFYEEFLWDWGYELGFAFPLWKSELIEESSVVSRESDRITLEFLAPYDYDINAITDVVLQYENGRWVIGRNARQRSLV